MAMRGGEGERLLEVDEEDIARLARARTLASGYREAARRALGFARQYRAEEGPGGARERACVEQALAWRRDAREVRAAAAASGPGLARARRPAGGALPARKIG